MYYDTTSGRYLSMVPTSPNGDLMYASPFVYAKNNPLIPPIPPVGNLTIEIDRAPTSLGNCGEAEFYVKWKITGKVNGWILQHVKKTVNVTDCAGNQVQPVNKQKDLTEGWQVVDGIIYTGQKETGKKGDEPKVHQTDRFGTHDEGNNRKGTIKMIGTVKFVAGYDLKMPPWRVDPTQGTGSLPIIVPTPTDWTEQGTQRHELTVVFECCCPPKQQTVSGVPS